MMDCAGYPIGPLAQGPDGCFYGTTQTGSGTVFKMATDGTVTTLATLTFASGRQPYSGLVLAPDGNFYGTGQTGGTYDWGAVFRVSVPMAPVFQSVKT
jgi:hypothetical protein